jgi:inner membrane protein
VRRRRDPTAAPARAGPLLAVSALALFTHPVLDWLNNYGIRWLMPFDRTWFYGDALFVIDPWVWLVLGGVLCVRYSSTRASQAAWAAFWVATSLLVLLNATSASDAAPLVPPAARGVWLAGIAAVAALRWKRDALFRGEAALDRAAAAALAVVAAYMAAMVGASAIARAQVRDALAAAGVRDVERVMVAPVPANPFAGEVVVETADAYLAGDWRWLASPRLALRAERYGRPRGAAYEAAARTRDAALFLTWSRFPIAEVEALADGGFAVSFSDARYRATGRLLGPTVELDRDLRPR